MSYEQAYSNMIYGIWTLADLTLSYPPADNPGRFAYASDAPGGAGFVQADPAIGWIPTNQNLFAAPVARTLALGSAYQATISALPAIIAINVSSNSSNALLSTAQASQVLQIITGPTAASVTGGTGTIIGVHENTQGGVLVVGLTITQKQTNQYVVPLKSGWYFGVRQFTGANGSIVSAFDQAIG